MIGTALLTEAKVHATVASNVEVSGSLGGLQVMNLLSGSSLHQKILSVGKDPMIEENKANDPGGGYSHHTMHADLYGVGEIEVKEEKQAFTFSVVQTHGEDGKFSYFHSHYLSFSFEIFT